MTRPIEPQNIRHRNTSLTGICLGGIALILILLVAGCKVEGSASTGEGSVTEMALAAEMGIEEVPNEAHVVRCFQEGVEIITDTIIGLTPSAKNDLRFAFDDEYPWRAEATYWYHPDLQCAFKIITLEEELW